MEFVRHVIDGQETESASGERFASVDPWTRGPVDREPVDPRALGRGRAGRRRRAACRPGNRAVRAARRAFDEGPWPKMGHAERGALLHRFADLIEAASPSPTPWSCQSEAPAPLLL